MMKYVFCIFATILSVVSMAPSTFAQEKGSGRAGKPKAPPAGRAKDEPAGRGASHGQGGESARKSLGQAMQDELNLTDKQRDEIKKLFKEQLDKRNQETHGNENAELKKELEEVQGQIRKARKANDKPKLASALHKMKELRQEAEESWGFIDKELLDNIAKVLDEKQREKFWAIVDRLDDKGHAGVAGKYREALKGVDLDKDQAAALEKILKDFEDQADKMNKDKKDPEAAKALVSKLRDEIMAKLDEKQQAALKEAFKGGGEGREGRERGSKHEGRPSEAGRGAKESKPRKG